MKNCIILVMVLVLGVSAANAQENVSIGPIAGVSIANFRGNKGNIGNQSDPKAGLTVGGFYNYSSKSGFGFTGQLLFTQMGAQVYNKGNEINLNYIQVPLLATFFFGKFGDQVRPKLFVGPSLNFLVGAKDKDGNNLNPDSNNRVYNPFDLGVTFGAGVNIRLQQKIWLNLDARYGLGLLDVSNDDNKLHNGNFGVNVGLSFPLGTYDKNSGRLKTN